MHDVVHACWQRQEVLNLYKWSISVITETQFATQTQVTEQHNCTEHLHVDVVQEFYAQKGPFTKQIATEGFSTVFGKLMSPL